MNSKHVKLGWAAVDSVEDMHQKPCKLPNITIFRDTWLHMFTMVTRLVTMVTQMSKRHVYMV